MPPDERLCFAINLDYLWRCSIYATEQILDTYDNTLASSIQIVTSEFQEKEDALNLQLEAQNKQISELKHKIQKQGQEFQSKIKNYKMEKDRFSKIGKL